MPDVIKLLPDSVANQIAAGEVIQRPASVVKELMENSVDAGATSVTVIIKDSGRTMIQVSDDGSGMSETDARLSFERHATSKIEVASDLFSINTKGFRGEALASIAAVAMVELKTRRKGQETGTRIQINGSKVEVQEPCSCHEGSAFIVRNLFYNIPARRKFLKSDNTEFRHILNEFQKVALPHPSIKFILIHNDSEIYNLPAGNLRQRITGIFGKPLGNDLISLDTQTSLIKISGYIGKPESARRTFGEQFFFVNNRFMKHAYFHKALTEAYHNIIPADVIPVYYIFLECDPANIDINIHPTKTEIKFEDERAIWQILLASVRESLGRFNITPSLDFGSDAMIDIPVIRKGDELPSPPSIKINSGFNPFDQESGVARNTFSTNSFERENTKGWEKLFGSPDKGTPQEEFTGSNELIRRQFLQHKMRYIVCPVKSGLMFIDQKRAHEKVLFETLLKSIKSGKIDSQRLLYPSEAELNPSEILIIDEILNDLSLMGFEIHIKDGMGIVIESTPAGYGLDKSDPVTILKVILNEYRETEKSTGEAVKERIAAAMASALAIPYGKVLSAEEMELLFDSLFACPTPGYTHSGKPVLAIITSEEIDKKF